MDINAMKRLAFITNEIYPWSFRFDKIIYIVSYIFLLFIGLTSSLVLVKSSEHLRNINRGSLSTVIQSSPIYNFSARRTFLSMFKTTKERNVAPAISITISHSVCCFFRTC